MDSKKGQTGLIVLVIVLLVLVGAGLFFLLGGRFIFTGDSTYNGGSNCREVRVPYTEQELYSDSLEAKVVDVEDDERNSSGDAKFYTRVDLRNTDNEGGWFKVIFTYDTLDDGKRSKEVRHYVEPDEAVSFEYEYDISSGEDVIWSYRYESDSTQRVRLVTKYRVIMDCY